MIKGWASQANVIILQGPHPTGSVWRYSSNLTVVDLMAGCVTAGLRYILRIIAYFLETETEVHRLTIEI